MIHGVPVPARMRKLKLDPRGFPIAEFAYVDSAGVAQFAINDEDKRQHHIYEDLCPICGQKLLRFRWFVGGPASAFHPKGMYIDPPMHDECAHYSLQVCPYLAAPSYSGRVDAKRLGKDDPAVVFHDPTMLAHRPDFFVAVCARQTKWFPVPGTHLIRYLAPSRPYVRAEGWRQGQQVQLTDALVADAMAVALAAPPGQGLVKLDRGGQGQRGGH